MVQSSLIKKFQWCIYHLYQTWGAKVCCLSDFFLVLHVVFLYCLLAIPSMLLIIVLHKAPIFAIEAFLQKQNFIIFFKIPNRTVQWSHSLRKKMRYKKDKRFKTINLTIKECVHQGLIPIFCLSIYQVTTIHPSNWSENSTAGTGTTFTCHVRLWTPPLC
jgi:hypothetical protein